ncbi:hypothetical protein DSCOOX_54110 [Desulfosarcina ovata subsp. ovata]|uniref:Uncharacterized protein n=1 Tax=Desulfosarcina ovata subsp. ovata TaxID=2752305 RepID=A0A5K8AHW6_9BACT|nr:hypothetical protein DSCOOX_54110 [Desulfosarcina ovata subsp. ovata]
MEITIKIGIRSSARRRIYRHIVVRISKKIQQSHAAASGRVSAGNGGMVGR